MQPKTIQLSEHSISKNKIDPHAAQIITRLQEEGFETYLVGGGVRDLLMGHTPKDYDISTAAPPEEIKKIFRRSCLLIGRRFRLAHIRYGKKIFEVSTFRTGDLDSEELILRDNEWGTEEQDVLRRDFTMNGLFYCPNREIIIDYVGGFEDIQKQRLRCIGQPHVRFKQDPVRMIRLIKFEARFGLNVDEELKIALLESRKEIVKSSPARVLEEVLRMLESGSAEKFIHLMSQHGLTELLMPGLAHFLESSFASLIYDFLKEIDYMHKEFPNLTIHRSILLAGLTYPILHQILLNKIKADSAVHLGMIQEIALDIIHEVFSPFLILPRRLKATLFQILFTQYRLTPPLPKSGKKRRIPHSEDFLLCMQFFNLRVRLDPLLKPEWDEWSRLYERKTKER